MHAVYRGDVKGVGGDDHSYQKELRMAQNRMVDVVRTQAGLRAEVFQSVLDTDLTVDANDFPLQLNMLESCVPTKRYDIFMFYRREFVNDTSPAPQTFREFMDMCDALVTSGRTTHCLGNAVGPDKHAGNTPENYMVANMIDAWMTSELGVERRNEVLARVYGRPPTCVQA